jgi:hypothetical protein
VQVIIDINQMAAVTVAAGHKPDVILLDLGLPDHENSI